jgi:cytochrome c1
MKNNPAKRACGRRAAFPVGLLLVLSAAFVTLAGSVARADELRAEDVAIAHGCITCHRIPGIPEAKGLIGPSLRDFGSKRRIAGDKLLNTPENLRLWLKDPKSIKPTLMPDTHLNDKELDVLVKFLQNL